ncbi:MULTISPECIES: hypothetical protein [Oceanimonas]|uniref:Uncharacterized protein n=1 Tax=Oceanimonas doudoroffii TaxID=84158 RepID=A0A233RH73_9GAMM|nr:MULTISPECIES: hypothetical protein [Oceanimonas]NHI00672.1 hypothetical protein [Oceanimonas sp. MB9]OXY82738.1 hypothetical protein B6S08_04275 [Oceanimonas doudoroffii]
MKTLMSLALAALFSVAVVPAQAAPLASEGPIVSKTLSMGDGIDRKKCQILKKRGMKLPGYCGPN